MAEVCQPGRRRFLSLALCLGPVLLTGCGDTAPARPAAGPARPFRAAFAIPTLGQVRLDYRDEASFRLEADAGPGATLAVAGEIYLHVPPSLVSQEARLLHLGRLGPMRTGVEPVPELARADVPLEHRQRWGLTDAPQRTRMPAPLRGGPAAELLVADVPDLARGQHVIGVRLRDSMDMTLCGDVVGRLLATWSRAVTGNGLAVLAHSSGIELAGPLMPFAGAIALPSGIAVEDYRLRPA